MKTRRGVGLFISMAVLFGLFDAAHTQTVNRGPYLQIGTPTSIVVRWRTTTATDTRVNYGSAPASLTLTADDPTSTTEHEIKLTGLLPDTKYYYSIGTSTATLAGGDENHFFVTSPVAGTSKPTRIWVLGDAGTKNDNQRKVRDAYYNFTGSRHTDLWMMLGDNAYSSGTDSEYQLAVFENMYEAMLQKSALWPTRGNHDSATESGVTTYYKIFSLPTAGEAGGLASGTEVYYSFDYGNIHFICLESTNSTYRATNSAMWTWLDADLAANDKNWTIAFWHHPPYSKGSHNSDSESQLIEMRERANPLLEESGVDLVLCGHSHSYERTFLLDGHYGASGTLTPAMKLDAGSGRSDGDGAYSKDALAPTPHAGAVYVVAGSSGHTSSGSLNHPAMFTSLKVLGSVVLDIDGNRLDATFINENGATLDYFAMIKSSPQPASQLAMISGNDQTAPAGSTLPNPFVVEARDADNNPVSGVAVTFAVATGSGSLSNSQPQVTGANGRASTTLTLGPTPGANEVTASATDLIGSPQLFAASGNPPPPTVSSFNPSKGPVGTEVTITGSKFTIATSVAFNGTNDPTFVVVSDDEIVAHVPTGATTGKISVTDADGAGFSTTNFTLQYFLTVSTVSSGTVSLNPTGGLYDSGTVVTLTANPAAGFQFSGWSGDLSGSANPATIAMNADKNVIATFTESGPGGAVAHEETRTGGSTSSATVTTSVSLTAASGQLYLAAISSKPKKTVNAVSGLGLSWTLVRSQCAARNQTGVEVWMAQGTPAANGTVTATLASAPKNAVIAVSRYSGVAASSPIGNVVSGNTKGTNGACSGGVDNSSYSFNLSTTVNGAVAYGAAAMRNKTHTPGAGYTERAEVKQGSGGSMASAAVEDKSVASASTVTVNGTFNGAVDWAVVALEIKPSSASASQPAMAEVEEMAGNFSMPAGYQLYQNYPNPFNAQSTIEYYLPQETKVRLAIFNTLGQLIRLLVDENQTAGHHHAVWDGKNGAGEIVSSGIYFYQLDGGGQKLTGRMTLQQ